MLDALPFVNYLWVFEMTGAQVREVLEQSLTLARAVGDETLRDGEADAGGDEGE